MDEIQLKPLTELYAQGTGQSTIDPRSERFMPLLLSIEKAIVEYNAQEVSKSIERRNRVDGVRGYLDFIRKYVR